MAPEVVLTCEVGMANFVAGAATLVDEVDHFILDDSSFDNLAADAIVIGFTATPVKLSAKSNEKRLMELLGFRICDTLIEPVSSQSTSLVTITLENFMAK